MKIVIPGGHGQVGRILIRAFRSRGEECVVLTRKREKNSRRTDGVKTVVWDGKTPGPWADEIDGADVVINLAGRSVDCRYHARNLAAMMSSRVNSTRIVGVAIAAAKNPPRVWLQASTAAIYAHRYDAPNDEATGKIGGNEPGVPALWAKSIAIAKAWEAELAAAQTPHTRKIALRSAMTMSPDRGGVFSVLARLCRMGVGRQGDGHQFVSWIHEDDFVAAVDFLIAREDLVGAFNLCAPEPLPNRDFMEALRGALGTKFAIPVPRWAMEIGAFFMRTETELVLKSRRVLPTRLLQAGFIFRHPRWPEAAKDLVLTGRNGCGRGALTPRGTGHESETSGVRAPRPHGSSVGKVQKPDEGVPAGGTISPKFLNRKWRIALELLGPAPIGVLVWVIGADVRTIWQKPENWIGIMNSLTDLPLMILFAYLAVGIQSLVYMAILEWSFSRGLNPSGWRSVGLSTLLGLASGVAIVAAYGFDRADVIESLITSGGTGVSVGLILGVSIKFLSEAKGPA